MSTPTPPIIPTVGRVVLYHCPAADMVEMGCQAGDVLSARIAWVYPAAEEREERKQMVNLAVLGANGIDRPRFKVPLVQPGQKPPMIGGYCDWMPYQVGQAAKTEEVEKQLKSKGVVKKEGATV